MRARSAAVLVLLALPLAALPASAVCQVTSLNNYPDINYTTVCVLDEGSIDDPYQSIGHDYIVHVGHAIEADPAFNYAHAQVAQGHWTYDDPDAGVHQEREWTDVSAGDFVGVSGAAGGGFHFALTQRDQTASEDGDGACSGITGQSTCFGTGGWLTLQGIASVGVGAYHQQSGTGESCQEQSELDVDAIVVFVPLITDPQPCTAELPLLYDIVSFGMLPAL
jgi:hypothetical protein